MPVLVLNNNTKIGNHAGTNGALKACMIMVTITRVAVTAATSRIGLEEKKCVLTAAGSFRKMQAMMVNH